MPIIFFCRTLSEKQITNASDTGAYNNVSQSVWLKDKKNEFRPRECILQWELAQQVFDAAAVRDWSCWFFSFNELVCTQLSQ